MNHPKDYIDYVKNKREPKDIGHVLGTLNSTWNLFHVRA